MPHDDLLNYLHSICVWTFFFVIFGHSTSATIYMVSSLDTDAPSDVTFFFSKNVTFAGAFVLRPGVRARASQLKRPRFSSDA